MIDFTKVLKELALKSLQEKWYDVNLKWVDLSSNCPFCYLALLNKGNYFCENCVLEQFINKKKINICEYIGEMADSENIEDLKLLKKKVIGWLEQISKYGDIKDVGI